MVLQHPQVCLCGPPADSRLLLPAFKLSWAEKIVFLVRQIYDLLFCQVFHAVVKRGLK